MPVVGWAAESLLEGGRSSIEAEESEGLSGAKEDSRRLIWS